MGLNTVTRAEGKVVCPSMMTFVCCAHTVSSDQLQVDSRGIEHFPLIEIQSVWKHSRDLGPIRTMSMQLVVNLLDAVEWNIFSDYLFGQARRTNAWLQQAVELVGLLRKRIYYFVRCTSTKEILNIPGYVDLELIVTCRDHLESGNYDSDEDIGRTKKARYTIDDEQEVYEALINNKFIFDMDSMLSSIYSRLATHDEHVVGLEKPPKVCINHFRLWIMTEIKNLNIKYVSSACENWCLDLIFSSCYQRIEARTSLVGAASKKQAVYKRNFRMPETLPRTFLELETPTVRNRSEHMRINTDAMLMHLSTETNTCQTVYLRNIPYPTPIDGYYIYYLPVTATWVCFISANKRYACESLTHAFVVLRTYMRVKGESNIVRRVRLDQFDGHIFQ